MHAHLLLLLPLAGSFGWGCASEPMLPLEGAASEQQGLSTPHIAGALSGSASLWVSSVATHWNGDIVVVGTFQGTADLDPGPDTYWLTSAGGGDVFVARYDSNLSLQWAFRLGGPSWDEGNDVALDEDGDVFITGYFQGAVDFDPSGATYTLTPLGSQEAFLAAYNPLGGFAFARSLRSSFLSHGTTVSVGADGHIVWGGGFYNEVDGDLGNGTKTYSSAGGQDAFIARYTPALGLVYFRTLGGTGSDITREVAIAPNGDVAVTGSFQGTAQTSGAPPLTSAGASDAFLAHLTPGGGVNWLHGLGGSGEDSGHGVAFGLGWDAVFVSGHFEGSANFNPHGSLWRTSAGGADIFLGRYKSSGGAVAWVHSLGSTGTDTGADIATHPQYPWVLLGGSFQGKVDFDPDAPVWSLEAVGTSEMYGAQYDFDGKFVHAVGSEGSGNAQTRGVSLDTDGASVLVGSFDGSKLMKPALLNSPHTAGFLVRRKP